MDEEQKVNTDEVSSITRKIDVGLHTIYLKLGWRLGRPVYVDIKLSVIKGFSGNGESRDVVALRTENFRSTNASIEIITRQTSVLLEEAIWDLDKLCDQWRGTRVFYGGVMANIPYVAGRKQVATGILDAAARMIGLKKEEWSKKMRDDGQIEHMIEECLTALSDDETIFSTWEQTFLESLENTNDERHLTDKQIKKLEQIYEDKVCNN